MLTLIQDAKKLPGDKIRLFLIYYLSNPDIPDADVTKFEQALRTAQCDVSPIQYAKNVKMYSKMTLATLELHGQNQKSSNIDYLGSFTSNLTKLTESLGSTGISEKLGNFVQGVKDMLPTKKELPVTQVVDAILEGRNNATCLEDYITLDPKSQQSSVNRGHNFKEAIVFMIGGGNYYEYLNLVEHFKVISRLIIATRSRNKENHIWRNGITISRSLSQATITTWNRLNLFIIFILAMRHQ